MIVVVVLIVENSVVPVLTETFQVIIIKHCLQCHQQFFLLFIVPSTKIVCYRCGLNIFKELAYQFRCAIKPTEILPANLRNRENCYYGKNCRTQYSKPSHAQKFNHACDQTRT